MRRHTDPRGPHVGADPEPEPPPCRWGLLPQRRNPKADRVHRFRRGPPPPVVVAWMGAKWRAALVARRGHPAGTDPAVISAARRFGLWRNGIDITRASDRVIAELTFPADDESGRRFNG